MMDISQALESTLLKADTKPDQIRHLCEEAIAIKVVGVCVPPYYVKDAVKILADTGILTVSVGGFPMGYQNSASKIEDMKRIIQDGADEVDVVAPIAAIKAGHWTYVDNQIKALAQMAHLKDKPIKLIIETGLLTRDEIEQVCELAVDARVNYIKTSTGMLGEGPTPEDIRFLRSILPVEILIKASAGIRTFDQAKAMIEAGATRIGTSSAGVILAGR